MEWLILRLIVPAATDALRKKKVIEGNLTRLRDTRFQLEMQVQTLESASFNAETMAAMKGAARALKDVHRQLCVSLSIWTMTVLNSV